MKILKGNRLLLLMVVSVFTFVLTSCEDDQGDQQDVVSQQDHDFAVKASNSNISEIRLGELAFQKSEKDSVMNFGKTMIMDHTAARYKLDSIAADLKIDLPKDMDQAHQAIYNRLSGLSSFAFDTAYMNSQVRDHQSARSMLEAQVNDGLNPELVEYAGENLPIVEKHSQRASNILTWLNDNADNSTGGQ